MASAPLTGARRRAAIIIVIIVLVGLLAGGMLLFVRRAPPSVTAPFAAPPAEPKSLPPAPWTPAQLRDLLGAVRQADLEGLRSADYGLDALQRDAGSGATGASIDAAANTAALALAHDYSAGRVRNRHRFNWYIEHSGPDAAALGAGIAAARAGGQLKAWLLGLLPTSRDYAALRSALATTLDEDGPRRDRIKANMERWRWLPRDFGQGDQLYVNLPRYQLDVVRGGITVATYRTVIGAVDMPTPALSATVRQIIVNPDWIVPQSIVRKSHLRPGASSRYVFTRRPDGTLRVRQKPGAHNALGKVKIEFPNALAIYFHDTPSRSLFGASERMFSHGCVRVQNIDALARSIVANPGRYATAFAGTQTRSLPTKGEWRATIVYLTLVADADGALRNVGDPYRLDESLAAALEGRKPMSRAAPAPPATAASTARPSTASNGSPAAATEAILAPAPASVPSPVPAARDAPAPAATRGGVDAAMDDAGLNGSGRE